MQTLSYKVYFRWTSWETTAILRLALASVGKRQLVVPFWTKRK